jgi:HEAT repeats
MDRIYLNPLMYPQNTLLHGRCDGRFRWHKCSANFEYLTRITNDYSQTGLKTMKHNPFELANKRSPDTLKSLEALEKFTVPIVEYFINALNNEDKWVRYLAADALGNMGDLRSIAYLDLLRSDKDPDLRFVSGQSLSKIACVREILTDSRKMGCDTCLIRYIAEEVIVQQNHTKSA